jgi:plasmid maintenance system antidote protein VapI
MAEDKLFDDLLKQHGAEELARSHVFSVDLNAGEDQETNESLQEILRQRRSSISLENELRLSLMQLRFQIENYLNEDYFDSKITVGYFLTEYIRILGQKQKKLASEINVTATELNQYIKNSRALPMEIMVRLELHSHGIIPAEDWLALISKEKFHLLKANESLREQQKQFVII